MADQSSAPSPRQIRARVAALAFDNRVVQNDYRGIVAEVIVKNALGEPWSWVSGDWRGWDFEHADGTRLEVKQSAARQTWTAPKKPSPPRFDIRTRTGYYIGADWHAEVARHAHIYVFAYHPILDESADHCDPQQWRFHVVPASALPENKTIGLARVMTFAAPVHWGALSTTVEAIRLSRG
jgi:hypothetical protein